MLAFACFLAPVATAQLVASPRVTPPSDAKPVVSSEALKAAEAMDMDQLTYNEVAQLRKDVAALRADIAGIKSALNATAADVSTIKQSTAYSELSIAYDRTVISGAMIRLEPEGIAPLTCTQPPFDAANGKKPITVKCTAVYATGDAVKIFADGVAGIGAATTWKISDWRNDCKGSPAGECTLIMSGPKTVVFSLTSQ
jgi:hypothetical protein